MILIIGAMAEEVEAIVSVMDTSVAARFHDLDLFQGTINSHSVVVSQSGIGKVNAAYTATMLINHFNPDLIINVGSAGGLLADQEIGDIVIATELTYHDLYLGDGITSMAQFQFRADPHYVAKVAKILKQMGRRHHQGLIVSGDQFVTKDSAAFRTIQATYKDAICVEMEATAIAAVCHRFQTPFVVIRSLSDVIHHEDNALDFEKYLALASANSAQVCIKVIRTLLP